MHYIRSEASRLRRVEMSTFQALIFQNTSSAGQGSLKGRRACPTSEAVLFLLVLEIQYCVLAGHPGGVRGQRLPASGMLTNTYYLLMETE